MSVGAVFCLLHSVAVCCLRRAVHTCANKVPKTAVSWPWRGSVHIRLARAPARPWADAAVSRALPPALRLAAVCGPPTEPALRGLTSSARPGQARPRPGPDHPVRCETCLASGVPCLVSGCARLPTSKPGTWPWRQRQRNLASFSENLSYLLPRASGKLQSSKPAASWHFSFSTPHRHAPPMAPPPPARPRHATRRPTPPSCGGPRRPCPGGGDKKNGRHWLYWLHWLHSARTALLGARPGDAPEAPRACWPGRPRAEGFASHHRLSHLTC